MNVMLAIERYLDARQLEQLEDERQLTLEGWLDMDPWQLMQDEDDAAT